MNGLDVVIVTYHSAAHLPRVLGALGDGVDVVVVDNASSDGSADIAEAHGATVVRGAVNAGFAAGCNRGAARGDADKILFLNPDAVIEPGALATLVAAMDADPRIGVASPRLVHPDGSAQRVRWPYPSAHGAWREALGLAPHPDEESEGFVIGACFLVRREAFESVGGFDTRFWLYGEEAELCRRVEDAGWQVRCVPSATAIHIGGASGGEDRGVDGVVFEHFQRGGEHFVDKHGRAGALVSYRAANLAGSTVRGVLGLGGRSGEHRRRMARLARLLAHEPGRVALDSPATRAAGKGLVVCSLEAWDEVWRRNQFFVCELLAADPDLRVLFVEPAFDVVHEKRRASGRRHRAGLRPVDGEGRVIRFEPVKWLPRKAGPFADRWRDAQVLDAVRQLGLVEPLLWVNDPSWATLADAVDWPAVYDITDDWTHAGDPHTRDAARRNEERLFARCEAVVVCSPALAASRSTRRDDVVLIPNGVDATDLRRPRPRPDDLGDGDTAVYVGTLHRDRLDVDLTARLARELDDVTVVLVGPDALDDAARAQLDAAGVIRVGPRPHGAVPGYLQHASVLIVPHVVSDFTESLDPIKAYECLAVGTPTVATPVAGFRGQGDPIRVAHADAFVAAVRHVLDDPPATVPRDVPSWADRAAAFADALDAARRAHHATGAVQPPRARHVGRGSVGAMPGATRRLVVNARFRGRPVTGVERYATELCARLPGSVRELAPHARRARPPLGHLWEQAVLPGRVGRDEVLWSPCNTGPARLGRQVVTIHDISPIEHPEWFSPTYGRWLAALTRQLVEHSLHIITVSEFTRERLSGRLGVDPERVSVVPNGISADFFEAPAHLTPAQRTQLGFGDRPYLLAVATAEPRKNLAAVITAFGRVRRAFPDLILVIAGSAGRRDIFGGTAGDVSGSGDDAVRHIGYVPEQMLPALYGSAEALVYIPHYEGFGLPPLEAAATGTSAVLSDIPALRETGLAASWVDPTDVENIAAGMTAHLTNDPTDPPDLRDVAGTYTWDRSHERLTGVFERLGITS